jgi:adenylate cyclase
MGTEIERRFKLESIQDVVDVLRFKIIEQQYLVTGDEEVRIRKATNTQSTSYTLTVKTGKGMKRGESEIEITDKTYDSLSKLSSHQPLQKIRYDVELMEFGDKLVEIDRFYHDTSLIVAEVEFEDEEEALRFVPPAWFGQEITRKSNFKNQNLWKSLNGLEDKK